MSHWHTHHFSGTQAKGSSPTNTPSNYISQRTGTVVTVMTTKANYRCCGKREEPANSAELPFILQYSTAPWPDAHLPEHSPHAPSHFPSLLNSGVPNISSDKCVRVMRGFCDRYSYLWETRLRSTHSFYSTSPGTPTISCVAVLISSYQAQQHAVISDLSSCCPAIHKMFSRMETLCSPYSKLS